MKNKPIIIVAGEPKSVFIEILLKSLKKIKIKSSIILICNKSLLIKQMRIVKIKIKFKEIETNEIQKITISDNEIYLINVKLNQPSKLSNRNIYIHQSFKIAFKLIKDNFSKKLINGPINKKNFLKKKYFGMTEYIANNFNIKKYGMLIYNKQLSVSTVTTHIPLKIVAKKINKNLILEKILLIKDFYKKNLKINPKIAVTGLNPHCESMFRFNEDEKVILPAIKFAKKNGIFVSGPYPADTIFLKQNRKKFDVILGMYHDQVLTPLKTLYEYDAINITMGLPFLRVSPDHGPNEKMINKNLSNPTSLYKALEFLDKN